MPDPTNKQPVPDRFKDISFDENPKPKKDIKPSVKPKATVAAPVDRFSDISFDEPVKKKDGQDTSTNTGAPSNAGTTNAVPSSSPLESSSEPAPAGGGFKSRSDEQVFSRKQNGRSNKFSFDPNGALDNALNPKKPTVSISGVPVPLDVPVPSDPQVYAKQLQDKLANKTYDQTDVDVVSKSMKVSPAAATAYMDGKVSTGTLIHFNDVKAKNQTALSNSVNQANKDLGLTDSFEDVYKTLESASAYLKKIQGLYEDKSAAGVEALPVEDYAFAGGVLNPVTINDIGRNKIDVEAIESENKNAAQKIKAIVTNDIADKIAARPDLTKEQKVKELYKLTDPKDLALTTAAKDQRLSPIRAMVDYMTGSDTKNEFDLLNSQKAGLEYQLNNKIKQRIDYNNALIGSVAESGDQATMTDEEKATVANARTENERLKKEYSTEKELLDKYPVLFKQKIVSEINDFLAIKSGNVKGEKGYEDMEVLDFLKMNGYDIYDQRVMDAIHSGDFKDYSFFGNPLKEAVDVFGNSVKGAGDLLQIRDEATIQAEKINAELFPTRVQENDQYQLTDAYYNGITDFSIGAKTGQNIGNTTGQVVGQAVFQYGTAGIGRMAGLSKLAAMETAFYVSGALPSYDQAYKDSGDFIENKSGRVLYAALIALSNAVSEKMFPDVKIFQIPGVKDQLAALASKAGTKEFTSELTDQALGKVKNAIVQYSKHFSKNVAEETAEEVSTQWFEDASRFIAGDPNASIEKAIENTKNTAYQTATGMLAIGLYGAHKDVRGEKNVAAKATLYNAALYPDEAMDAINEGFRQKLYDQAERDEKIKTVNTAIAAKAITEKTEKIYGKSLKRPERELYVANLTAEALLKDQIKDAGEDEDVKKGLEEKIFNLRQQRQQILKGEARIDDFGDVVDGKPVYKFNGKEIGKGEFLIRMNSKNVDDYDLEVTNDDAVQKALRNIGGKDISSLNTNKNGKVNSENGKSGTKAKGGEEVSQANQNAGDASGSSNEQGAEKVTATGAAGDNTAAPLPKQKPARYGPNDITPAEQTAIEGFKGKKFEGSVKGWTDVIQSETSTPAEKKLALKELGEQLSDPESEIAMGMALGTAAEGVYDLISSSKTNDNGNQKEGSQKTGSEKGRQEDVLNENDNTGPDKTGSVSSLTPEAETLLESVKDGSQPAFISKNLEKIAKDNGIEITDKMTAADVIDALKQKKEPTSSTTVSSEAANTDNVGGDVETKRKETEAKIKRKDLFSDGGSFANELGGSGVNSVPTNHSERNGIEFVQFSNPNTGVVDVIMTGKSDNDFVGYYRIYENGKATNKWSSKFENQSRNKEDFKTMISGVQEMLPQGHEYTEKTSISTDGLRVWNQQLSRGYELQYDSKGNVITNRVAINGDAINNELGIAVNKGNFENVSVTNNADMKKVKEALLPYLQKFGLNGGNIHFENGTVEIDLPVLKNTKAVEQSLSKQESGASNGGGDVELGIQQGYAKKAMNDFINSPDMGYSIHEEGGKTTLALSEAQVRNANGLKGGDRIQPYEHTNIELTKDEKKQLNKIESDKELGDIDGLEYAKQKRALAKKIFERASNELQQKAVEQSLSKQESGASNVGGDVEQTLLDNYSNKGRDESSKKVVQEDGTVLDRLDGVVYSVTEPTKGADGKVDKNLRQIIPTNDKSLDGQPLWKDMSNTSEVPDIRVVTKENAPPKPKPSDFSGLPEKERYKAYSEAVEKWENDYTEKKQVGTKKQTTQIQSPLFDYDPEYKGQTKEEIGYKKIKSKAVDQSLKETTKAETTTTTSNVGVEEGSGGVRDVENKKAEILSDVTNLRNAKTVGELQQAILKATQEKDLNRAINEAGKIVGMPIGAFKLNDIATKLADAIEKIVKPQIDKLEHSLKETTKVETPTKNVGVEEGSGGVGGDVVGKTFRDNYNRTFEVKGENAGILTLEDVDTGKVLRKKKSEVLSDFKEITEPDVVDKTKTITEHLPKGGELKGVTEIDVSENGEEVSYGTKTRKTSITVKGLSAEEIKQEIKFEKQVLERSKRDAANFNEDEIRSAKGMTRQEKEDAIKMHKQSLINNEQVEKIVIPFYEKHLEIAEQSLKETTKAETTTTNTGVEEGSGGVGGDVGVLEDGNGNVMGKGESKIIEVSADGKKVKVDNVNGWHPIENFKVDRVKSTSNKLENLSEKDFDKLTPSQKVALYKEYGITKEDGSPITEKDIENSPLQYSYDFMASSDSGKWNSANSELESLVKDHRKAYSLYKMLIGDNFAGDNNTFKDIVDYINNKTDANIEYTDRMRRADETMSAEERQAAVDSYNKSAEGKTEDKVHGRQQTRINVQKGVDLFPKDANIPEIKFSAKSDVDAFDGGDKSPVTIDLLSKKYPSATVVQSMADLPFEVQNQAHKAGIQVEGVLYNGKVYMVADNLPTMGRAEAVYKHETIGHSGVIGVLKDKLNPFMESLVNNATDLQKKQIDKLSQRIFNRNSSELSQAEKIVLGEEYVAQAAENISKYPTTWQKVSAFVRSALRDLGFKISVSDNDIKVLLARASSARGFANGTRFSGNYLQDLLNKVRDDISMQEPVTIAPDLKKYGDEMIDWVKQDNSGATYNDVIAELNSEVGNQFTEAEKEPLYRYIRQKMAGKYVEPSAQQSQPAAPQEPTGGDNGNDGNTGRRRSQVPMEGAGMTHADTAETRQEFNLPDYEKQAGTFQEWDEQARQRIADGKMQDVLDNLKMGFGLRDEVEQRMMGMYLAHLSDIAGESGSNEDIRNLYEAIKLSDRVGGSLAAKILTARKGLFDNDASLAGYWAREMEATHVDELTDEQIELNKQEFEDRQQADKDYEKELAKLKKQVAKWKAKAKLKEEKEKAERKASEKKKQSEPKTHEQLIIEKEKLTTSIKDKLRQARERKANPGIKKQNAAAPGFTPAPAPNTNPKLDKAEALALVDDDMQDYIRTLVDDDNSIGLDEVQQSLFDILEEDVDGLTMDDVTNVIAGDYTKAKRPLTDLQKMVREIKEEAKLVKKLKDLLDGKIPDKPEKKKELNKNIAALRKQIADIRKNIPDNEKRLQNYIDRIKKQADKVEEKLSNNDLSTDQRSPFLDDPALKAEFPELFDEAVSEKERLTKMNKKMQELRKELPYDEKDLQRYIDRQNKEAERIQAKIDAGDYSTDKKKPSMMEDADVRTNFPEQYKKALEAKDRVIKIKIDREVRLMKEELKNRKWWQKKKDDALELLNMPRTLMSSVDFSAPLRQGIIPTITHPSMAFGIKVVNDKLVYHGAFWQMFKYAFNKKDFDRWFHDLKESPNFQLMQKAGLYVADPHNHKLMAKEEMFMNNAAEKLPFLGRLVSGSERAYVGYLNKMRVDLFMQGVDLLESRQKYIETDLEDYQALAKWVGNSTGRGNMTDMMEKASPLLNATFFSPRLISSRLNLLNPVNYVQVFRTSPEVGKMMLGDMAKFVTFGLSVLAMASLNSDCENGEDKSGNPCGVEVDPRSTDFGKIRSGNTRYDIWGGFQPYVRVIAQFYSGKAKSTSTGEIINISGEEDPEYRSYFGVNRGTVVSRFFRGKLAPIPSLITDLIQKHTGMGDKINMKVHAPIPFTTWGGELPDKPGQMDLTDRTMQMIEPLVWQDLYKGWQDNGVKSLFTTLLPSTFGLGVATYEKKK